MGKRRRIKNQPDPGAKFRRSHAQNLKELSGASSSIKPSHLRVWLVTGIITAVLALMFHLKDWFGPPPRGQSISTESATSSQPAVFPVADYVGAQACAECHQEEKRLWRDSHHDLAMQPATEKNVAGDFNNTSFTYAGTNSIFFRRDGSFLVRTDGPEGQLRDYEIKYTFGTKPLQQYLIPLPDGRLQALGIAWDTRPKAQGGQRWFHLYPNQNVTHNHPLHWTSPSQNWNYMCAECHSTNLKKNYDLQQKRYDTTYSEMNVSCEACHGPGSNHVSWAKKEAGEQRRKDPCKGFIITFDERRSVQWTLNPETSNSRRSAPRSSTKEIEMCARCHSRRSQISEDYRYGPLGDTHRLSLLEDELYYPDGQMRDEVYVHGSFLQSKMFQQGVTCSDCHDPHSLHLRASKDQICLQCHAAEKYDSDKHHFHPLKSSGADCTACHMPVKTYMEVDPRHDHSFRIPRPDLSIKLGTPNTCNTCHPDRSPTWAMERLEQWYGHKPEGYQRFAEVLRDGSRRAPGAANRLLALAVDKNQPSIVRASALARIERTLNPEALEAIAGQLGDEDPLLREAAVSVLASLEPTSRIRLLAPLLRDSVRTVRVEAARVLGDIPFENLTAEQKAALTAGIAEYEAVQRLNADRPEAHLNLAQLYAAQGKADQTEASLRTALELDPGFIPASVNLADLYRALSREAEGEAILQAALKRDAGSAALHHSLGLLRVRQKRTPEALAELKQAVKLDSSNPRYTYVYGVALNSTGETQKAIIALQQGLTRHPFDRDMLFALATMYRDQGKPREALSYARTLVELEPENPGRMAFVEQLRQQVKHENEH